MALATDLLRKHSKALSPFPLGSLTSIYQGLNISKEFYKKKDFLKIPNENSDNK